MNSDFSDFIRFFPIFRLFPTFRLLDSTTLVLTQNTGNGELLREGTWTNFKFSQILQNHLRIWLGFAS